MRAHAWEIEDNKNSGDSNARGKDVEGLESSVDAFQTVFIFSEPPLQLCGAAALEREMFQLFGRELFML